MRDTIEQEPTPEKFAADTLELIIPDIGDDWNGYGVKLWPEMKRKE